MAGGASSGRQAPRHEIRIGICLSGGGIRSATFALGVLQRLGEAGILERARFLAGVSGGSYLGAAMAISNAKCPDHLRDAEPKPWARGSPEERELRKNLSYLAPGGRGRLWLGANVAYGVVLNLVPLLIGAYLCGRILGLVLGEVYPGLGLGEADWTALWWMVLAALALLVGSLLVVAKRRFVDTPPPHGRKTEDRGVRLVMLMLLLAAALLTLGVLLPLVLDLLGQIPWGSVTELGLGGVSFSLRRFAFGLALVAVSLALGGLALWLLRRRRLAALRGIFAYLSGAGILLAPFLLGGESGADRGWSSSTDLPLFLGSLATIVAFALFIHNRRYSMHFFYRERLQAAFASRRIGRPNDIRTKAIPYQEAIYLSEIARINAERSAGDWPPFPELVMCAAVAARGEQVPNKTWAASFTFEGQRSGNEKLDLWAPTRVFETPESEGGDDLTLPAMMAISGAAVSPLMGRFTLPAFRFLMAMMNIRLGVWIRNPRKKEKRPPPKRPGRTAAVLRSLKHGLEKPGARYVLREGMGLVGADDPYIYVSDGGHWENLGLTELLRRECTHVIVVDATSDPMLGDIGRAMGVARAELGVEFDLDPRETLGADGELSDSPVADGTFTYPERDRRLGRIVYARSVLWSKAPSDLHLFAEHEHPFPNHPTSNQFLSGELFDAYRALGWAVGGELAEKLPGILPPRAWEERQARDRSG